MGEKDSLLHCPECGNTYTICLNDVPVTAHNKRTVIQCHCEQCGYTEEKECRIDTWGKDISHEKDRTHKQSPQLIQIIYGACPICGSSNLAGSGVKQEHSFYPSQVYECLDCGYKHYD